MTPQVLPDDLSQAAWLNDPALRAVADALGGGEGATRLVGGAVRDSLLGQTVADIDLATRLLPQEVIDRLQAAGLKAVPTGLAHGTVTAVSHGRGFEVTTLRRDVETDGRHALVAYTDDWAEDAARRDFTINAIYADAINGALYDPVGGLADLAARTVRFIGDASARIDEDHLRILRWFRFAARFGDLSGDAETLALLAQRAPLLRSLSRERVADELLRILRLPDPVAAVTAMRDTGVLAEVAPEIDAGGVDRLRTLVAREAAAGIAADALRRLAALLAGDASAADGAAARLRLSTKARRRLATALRDRGGADIRPLAWRYGVEGARDLWLLSDAPTGALAEIEGWVPPRLPVSGRDVMAHGVDEGPAVARALRQVEDRWIAAGFPGRDAALAMIAAAIASPEPGGSVGGGSD